MVQLSEVSMLNESRREHFTLYTEMLRERFHSGMLAELQPLNQWVVWRAEIEDSKRKKVPYNPNYPFLARASVTTPKSWGTLNQALRALESGEYSGIGFMLKPPLVMIDLDTSFDRKTRTITITDQRAEAIVKEMNSFTEASPNNGLHVLCFGTMPGKNLHSTIEMYGQDRFTTITTDHIVGTPLTIENRQEALEALYSRFAPSPVSEHTEHRGGVGANAGHALTELPPEAAHDVVLQRLLQGDLTGYPSQSSADFVFIMKLLHWTGDDKALTRQLFLSSPLGKREKAQRKTGDTTYVDLTIENVLKKRRNPPQRR